MSESAVTLRLDEVRAIAMAALLASDTSRENAAPVADSMAAAEADGIANSGLVRLPAYCEHARIGKVDGRARPTAASAGPAAVRVDARNGFAHPAIDLALGELVPLARSAGIAAAAVTNSYNAGVVGHHAERLALQGLVGLAFANSPRIMAPWGGRRAFFGTNPVALACPRGDGPPIVVDQSSTVVARGEVLIRAQAGKAIPEHWGFDADGRPTKNPWSVLGGGTMAPAGGHKGAALALIVEIMAAGLTGAAFSFRASSFTDNEGGPPGTGQLLVAVDPMRFAGAAFPGRVEELAGAILGQPGARLPGDRRYAARRRAEAEGVAVAKDLYERILACGRGS
jgi:(2R)-3-sulfolactate dehydrogenase (NADP+)